MRPEDVTIETAAGRFCREHDVDPSELREVAASGQYVWEGGDLDVGWYVIYGPYRDDGFRLRVLLGPEVQIVADVRLIR